MISKKTKRRKRIKAGIRVNIKGTPDRPRMSIFRSNKDIYVQLVDDTTGHTLASASSREETSKGTKTEVAKSVGLAIAKKASGSGINLVVFDRGGFLYHGRVKALAEGAREGGLTF